MFNGTPSVGRSDLMKLCEIVQSKAIVTQLQSSDRDEVVGELVDALVSARAAKKAIRQELIDAVLEREQRGSTGFGRGVAVPHVKHSSAKTISVAIGLSQTGVEFNALDKQPVYSVFLLLSPEDNPEEHLQAMEVIFKSLSNEMFRRFLRQATTTDEVTTLLEEFDNQQLV